MHRVVMRSVVGTEFNSVSHKLFSLLLLRPFFPYQCAPLSHVAVVSSPKVCLAFLIAELEICSTKDAVLLSLV